MKTPMMEFNAPFGATYLPVENRNTADARFNSTFKKPNNTKLCNLLKTNIMKNITIDGVEYTPVIKENIRITQTLDFEVYHKDLELMTWYDMVRACKDLGKGWRMPTKDELYLIYKNKDIIDGLLHTYYWSSTKEYSNPVLCQYPVDGIPSVKNSKFKFNTRPVRDIKPTLASGGGTLTLDKNVPITYTNL